MTVEKVQVQILIKNSKYGHDYEVVRADTFFDKKILEKRKNKNGMNFYKMNATKI